MPGFGAHVWLGKGSGSAAMPIGVPLPSFGLYETAPSVPDPWDEEVPGFYYVNYTTGNDSRTYGYPALPRKTVPNPTPAGSVVVLAPGVDYWQQHAAPGDIDAYGTAAEPIWFLGDSVSPPVAKRRWRIDGSYFYVQDINWKLGGTGYSECLMVTGDHVAVRHCDLDSNGYSSSGMSISGNDYFVIYDCTVHGGGNYEDVTLDQDKNGIMITGSCTYGWFLNNEVHHMAGTGVMTNAGSASARFSLHHLYYGFNNVHDCHQGGISFKYCSDCIISQNDIHDFLTTGGVSTSPAKCVGYQYGPERLWVIFNKCYSSADAPKKTLYGIRSASFDSEIGEQIYIVGNVVWNLHYDPNNDPPGLWGTAAISSSGGLNTHVIGNSFYDCDVVVSQVGSGMTTYTVRDNLLCVPADPDGTQLRTYMTGSGMTVENDLFEPGVKIRWGASGPLYESVADFQSGTGKGAGCVEGDPDYISPPGDLRLGVDSDAREAGSLSDVYQAFFDLYGIDITKDADGHARPTGAWDIGAYECD